MNLHRFSLAAATLLALSHLPAGETRSRLDKNPIDNNPPIPPTPIFVEPPALNRFGVLATGGFGVDAEFVSDVFTKSLFSRICGCPGGAIHLES